MNPIPSELIGIPPKVLFRIPVAAEKDLLLMLSKEHALRVNALAQTNRVTAQQYAIELITRALESPLSDCLFERLSLLASRRRAAWPREAVRPSDPAGPSEQRML
jgi:hypothetical protein